MGTVICGRLFGATLLYPTHLKLTWNMLAYDVNIYVSTEVKKHMNTSVDNVLIYVIRNHVVHAG